MIQQIPVQEDNIVAFRLSGKLSHADYQAFLPRLEDLIKVHGRISVLLELADFHGWDLNAALDDFRFGMQHQDDFERIAIIGQSVLQHWMALIAKPFTRADVQCFNQDQLGEALHSDLIVVGTHGHRGIARLLGSTANAVSHNARCDVLTVHIGATD